MMHEMGDSARKLIDFGSFSLAGVAVISLSQAALIVTILAGLASLILAGIRVYDRIKFGPHRG
jgi:hypothetical protein